MGADIQREITRVYDVEPSERVALRASFRTDKDGSIHHQLINNKPLVMNVNEMLRVPNARQLTGEPGEVYPAGWHSGDNSIKQAVESMAGYLAKNADKL